MDYPSQNWRYFVVYESDMGIGNMEIIRNKLILGLSDVRSIEADIAEKIGADSVVITNFIRFTDY